LVVSQRLLAVIQPQRLSALVIALGRDIKRKISVVFYTMAIPLAFVNEWFVCLVYVEVAIEWLIPDRCIEKTLAF
jgi:hypothetical protein